MDDIFLVPVLDKYLLYSPLQHLAALVDRHAAQLIHVSLQSHTIVTSTLKPIAEQLFSAKADAPAIRAGALDNPVFLGIIPTRNCNLGCRYCDFAAPKHSGPVMDLGLARRTIDAYLSLLKTAGRDHAEVHFFGGEPFFARDVVQFIVGYAALRATELGLHTHFEAITNGLYNTKDCRWIADYFDTIILSLDGPADIQERQRPAINGHNTFSTITRNARIFSESAVELIIRVCVTRQTVARMAEIAAWLAQEFHPSTVCFETLTESQLSRDASLLPPSPWEFARNFVDATQVLREYGIEIVFSTTNLQNLQASFCPVGKDALIVSTDGTLNACYLLPEDWSRGDLDLCFGRVGTDGFEINDQALQRIRSLSVYDKTLCSNCLARYHCAGGCRVNHNISTARHYDDLCIETRLITIAKLLMQLKQDDLVDEWLTDQIAMEVSAMQSADWLPIAELNQ